MKETVRPKFNIGIAGYRSRVPKRALSRGSKHGNGIALQREMAFRRQFSVLPQGDSTMHGSKFRDGDEGTLVLGESCVGIASLRILCHGLSREFDGDRVLFVRDDGPNMCLFLTLKWESEKLFDLNLFLLVISGSV